LVYSHYLGIKGLGEWPDAYVFQKESFSKEPKYGSAVAMGGQEGRSGGGNKEKALAKVGGEIFGEAAREEAGARDGGPQKDQPLKKAPKRRGNAHPPQKGGGSRKKSRKCYDKDGERGETCPHPRIPQRNTTEKRRGAKETSLLIKSTSRK